MKIQFEILGITENNNPISPISNIYIQGLPKYDRPYINGDRKYSRIIIKRK